MINHDSNLNHSSLQTTSAPFYNNLAPSAIGTSAIVSAPMLLSQSNQEQVSIDSIRNSSITSTNNQLINFEPPSLRLPINQQNSQSLTVNSTTHGRSSSSRLLSSKDVPLRKLICKYCGEVGHSISSNFILLPVLIATFFHPKQNFGH